MKLVAFANLILAVAVEINKRCNTSTVYNVRSAHRCKLKYISTKIKQDITEFFS
jgi:hypothetical protein